MSGALSHTALVQRAQPRCEFALDNWIQKLSRPSRPAHKGAAIATALVTALVLHMVAPRTCFGAGDYLGLDAHLRQVGNVNLAAVGGVCSLAPLNARLAHGLVLQPAEQLTPTSEPSLPPSAFSTANFLWLISWAASSRRSKSLGTPPGLLWLLTCAWLQVVVSQACSWLGAGQGHALPGACASPEPRPHHPHRAFCPHSREPPKDLPWLLQEQCAPSPFSRIRFSKPCQKPPTWRCSFPSSLPAPQALVDGRCWASGWSV